MEGPFSRSASLRSHESDDEEALRWAALEKLPTYNRAKTAIIRKAGEDVREHIDVTKLGPLERRMIVDNITQIREAENQEFVHRLRRRIDNVGIELPKIEVRFEHLNFKAEVHVGSRALPTLINYVVDIAESILVQLRLLPSKRYPLQVLKDNSGIIKPSRMTLLLGPPSSGKTTLLRALAGTPSKSLETSGRVTYNGHDMTEFVPQRTSAYISQRDVHTGEMTVRETFDFASRCQGIGSRYEMIVELSRREKEAGIKPDPEFDAFLKAWAVEGQESSIATDYVLKILGLDICADTIVGDQMLRGISGGQKKRVTTGEMLVGPARCLFMDEISTGLDSSTTFQIVRSLRQTVHVLDATMVVSLLQPAPETFELFDDIILLSEGRIVYQGPRELVADFFESQGFKCPPRKSIADYLQEVISKKDQEQYWADPSKPYRYISVEEFTNAFQQSHVGQSISEELSRPFNKATSHPAALVTEKYALSNWEIFKAALSREVLLMKRNSFAYVFRAVQIAIMAFIALTVFLRPRMHHNTTADGTKTLGALFLSIVTILFNGFAELAMTIMRLPVFYKQRDLHFFPAWAFGLANIVSRLPLSFIEASAWVLPVYYSMGLAPAPGRFFRYYLVLVIFHQVAAALFRSVAALSRTTVIANAWGTLALIIFFVMGGFMYAKGDIRPWWIWAYWSSPLMYAQTAVSVNEFRASRWDKLALNSNVSIGIETLQSRDLFTARQWYWIGIGALCGFVVVFNGIFLLALTYFGLSVKRQAALEHEENNDTDRSRSSRRVSSRPTPSGRGMELPFEPLAMTFNEVNYFVDMPQEMKAETGDNRLQLLHGITGAFRPGVLTALVGVSGAGKTTLMDVLSGRKTSGTVEGDIRISGYPKKQETFARISGYCEQDDIHSPNLTIYESLVFSAWLRLSNDVTGDAKMMFVEEVMELVELTPLRDAIVGLPGINGLSTEQRKRLTIAVELVANPSIIFMDEPTSGLDARAAAIVMRAVRNTVNTGRTVVCTIHQPSIEIFEAFDELLLLKRGGRVIYAGDLGPRSCKLVEYFQAVPGVPTIKDGYNPATWMLEVSSADMETRLGVDFAEIYEASSLYRNNKNLIAQLSNPPPGSSELSFPSQYPLSFLQQCKTCLWKQQLSYWKNPDYIVIRMFFALLVALMFGTMFWHAGKKKSKQQNLVNLIGSIMAALFFIGYTNAATVQPVVAVERTVFYRERAAGMYPTLAYAIGQVLIEIPYALAQAFLYGSLVYAMMSLDWTAAKYFWFIYFLFVTFLYFTYYGMMAVALTPNEQIAAILSSAFYTLWALFCGFMILRKQIPQWWRWYYWGSPVAWSIYGATVSQLGDVTSNVELADHSMTTVKHYLESNFGFHHDFLGNVAGGLVGIVILFAACYILCLKVLNFQKR